MPITFPDDAHLTALNETEPDVGISLDTVEKEVIDGLPSFADKMLCHYDNEQYYRGRNVPYVPRRESEEYLDFLQRPKPTSKVTRKVVRTLTSDLYNPGPTRELKNSAALNTWLQEKVYKTNHINALMQQADRKATLNATAAIMAVATGDPEKPVKLHLFGRHQFCVFPHPMDATRPFAVATIEKVYEGSKVRLRIDLWSRDEHRVYLTKAAEETPNFQDLFGLRAQYIPDLSGFPVGSGANPYGVLPFCFVHDEPPVSEFDEGGIGTMLREINSEADKKLSQLSNHIDKFLDPDQFLVNVGINFRREKRPGGWQHLPPGQSIEGDAASEPKALIVQPTLNVQETWMYIVSFTNSGLEELDVPVTAVRTDASTDLSGIAIVAKHIPLLTRTKGRQVPFSQTETELATLVLTVAGNWYGDATMLAAAQAIDLQLVWPEPRFPLPTPERDATDAWEMEGHVKSLIDVVAERMGGTKEQAKSRILQVAEDNKWLATVVNPGPAVAPADGVPPGTNPPAAAQQTKGGNDQGVGKSPAPVDDDEEDDDEE